MLVVMMMNWHVWNGESVKRSMYACKDQDLVDEMNLEAYFKD